jgi:hypothetical protein
MFNPYVLRKYGALMLGPLLTVILFFIGVKFYNFWWGLGLMFVGLLASVGLGHILLKTPFRSMEEGKGLLTYNMDSTGVLTPFVVGLNNPYIEGNKDGKKIKDIFDRAAIFTLQEPVESKASFIKENKEGIISLEMHKDNYNKAKFGQSSYPVLIWNDQIKQFLTKDFFSNGEKQATAEHAILYLTKLVEDLNVNLLNFGRYIVETTNPNKGNWLSGNWWVILLIVFVIVVLGIMFGPAIMDKLGGGVAAASGSVGVAKGGLITPQ